MNDNIHNEVEENIDTTSNTNQILDLIQSIQSKINTENVYNEQTSKNTETTINTNTHENISNNNSNIENNTFDFSSLLKNIDLGSVLNTFGNFSQNNVNKIDDNTNSNNGFNLSGLDPSLLMKFGNMFSSATRNDPKRNLLLSLKPFLRKTRQDRLSEYVTILTIVDAIGIFNSKGSGK